MEFLAYLNAVRKHWWPLMSCGLFTGLGMWIFYADKSNAWAIRGTFGVAGFCLFWAGYRAWLDERQKMPQPALSLRQSLMALSTAILDFAYARSEAAPKITISTGFSVLGVDNAAWLQTMEKSDQEYRALATHVKETLEIYEYKYKRLVMDAIVSLKNLGLDSSKLEGCVIGLSNEANPDYDGISYPIDYSIKMAGKQLGILADQINEP